MAFEAAKEILQSVLKRLLETARPVITRPIFIKLLGTLLTLGIITNTNKALSSWVLNNWQRSPPWKPEREIVLLTGGCGGIGQVITRDLSRKGVKVLVVDVSEPKSSLPPNAYFLKADITSSSSVKALAETIRAQHGDPTILINNAGLGFAHTVLDVPEDILRKTFEVNTISHYLMVKEFLPSMIRDNHGHVITVASMASFVTVGEMVDYACTKASALAFHEGLGQELRYWYKAPKVRTSIIHPIFVKTPMIQHYTDAGINSRQPLLAPEDVSAAVVKQIISQSSGQVILPASHTGLSLIRGLPHWLQESIRGYGSLELKNIRRD